MQIIRMNIIASIALGAMTGAMAQTKVQCHFDSNGYVSAALIWQNTLGTERANSICRASFGASGGSAQPVSLPPDGHVQNRNAPKSTGVIVKGSNSVVTHRDLNPGRFDPDVYARALDGRTIGKRQSHKQASLPTLQPVQQPRMQSQHQNNPPMNDYVPLEESGHSDIGTGGYIAIW